MSPFLATASVRILALVGAGLLLFAVGYWKGAQAVQLRWDAAIAQQAIKSADTVVKAAENTAQVITKYIKVKGETEIVTQTIEKEVIKYVEGPAPKCSIDADFERVFDLARRVPDSTADGLPPAPSASGRADAETVLRATSAEVLRATAEDADACTASRDQLTALIEWNQTTYEIQKAGADR